MKNLRYKNLALIIMLVMTGQTFAIFLNAKEGRTKAKKVDGKFNVVRSRNPLPPPAPTSTKNGIYVDPVKVLDDRSLAQNLQQIEANLANVRFFDQNSLNAAIGTLQGARLDSSSLSVAVTTQPSASLETATTTDTSATGAATQKVVETEKQGSNTPTAPTAVQPTSTFTPPSTFRLSAQDLLAEQMSMTYQVINLRTFLQRSLSDRKLTGKYSKTVHAAAANTDVTSSVNFSGARAVAVLGFNISVNNPEQYKDAVAEIKIEVANKVAEGTDSDGKQYKAQYSQSPSLIMQSPVEKTYNVATITKDAKSFSLGAAVQVLNVGVSAEKKSETLYLVRDNDTVAFSDSPFETGEFTNASCPNASNEAISFGWQFRPVLGRRSVEPGPRKVMAMIALPNSTNLPYDATIRVQTRWLKFDRKRKVVGAPIGTVMTQCLDDLEISSIQDTQKSLTPKAAPQWSNIGSGLASITLTGENFLPGASVVVGDTTYNQSVAGFKQSGEDEIKLVVPIQKLAQFQDIYLASDYGGLQPIQNPLLTEKTTAALDPKNQPGWGIKINGITAASSDGQNVKLTVKVAPVKLSLAGVAPVRPKLVEGMHHAVVIVGDQVFDAAGLVSDDPADANGKLIELKVPLQLADSGGKLIIKDLFWGNDYTSVFPIDLSGIFALKKIEILATDGNSTWLALRGTSFANSNKVIIAGTEYSSADATKFKFRSSNLIEVKVDLPDSQLKNIKQLTLTDGTVYLPGAVSTPTPKLTIQIDKVGNIAEGEVKDVMVEGLNLNNVSYVLFVNDQIPFSPFGDGKKGTLTVTRELSRVRGNQQLNFVLKDGTVIPYLLKINSL